MIETAWKIIEKKHHHGIQVPLLSLWTEKSSGNGEFLDLIPLIDFLSEVGMDILQLLPLNDSGSDASPYNALSSTALHPIYLSLHALPFLNRSLPTFKITSNRLPYYDILERKLEFLKSYVQEVGDKIISSQEYQSFASKNPHLETYARYKVLKDNHHGHHWKLWSNTSLSNDDPEITFHLILQFLSHLQLETVKNHADKKGVFLVGDIPILLSPDSADVWAHQEFFDLSLLAGSPPGPFDPKGQLWNLPLYKWNVLEENHFEWWRRKIQSASQYFHLYRIDHILGFFRIWAIPQGKSPADGSFIPDDPVLMKAQGQKLLETFLSFSTMLPLGEDLGDPPPFVHEVMDSLGIPGLKIFRRNRRWETDRSFIPYKDYPPLSVSSVSTHDLEPLSLWWKMFPDEAKDYATFKHWNYTPTLSPQHLHEILYDNHHSGSLFHINPLQEYLGCLPHLTWENPEDEQINIPGTESSFNWTYRFRRPLETLTTSPDLKQIMQSLL
jgi:4-alpha-glucanotransferase